MTLPDQSADHPAASPPPAAFIDAPRNPTLQALLQYWSSRRGTRAMPSRADISPAGMKPLLPFVMMWSVENTGEPYRVRLVGEHIVRFVGQNHTGQPATHTMPPDAAASMLNVLGQVCASRAPRFRIGKAFWKPEKAYCDYEACFLPLSADGETVNLILGGLKFDYRAYP